MQILPLTIEHYTRLHQLWLDTPGMGLNDYDDSREGIARYLARNPHTSFVAMDDERLVGCILAGHDGRRGYIHHTAVDAAYRHQGIGRALTEAALDELRNEGIRKVALVAFATNETGNAYWERQGFTERPDLRYRNRVIAADEGRR